MFIGCECCWPTNPTNPPYFVLLSPPLRFRPRPSTYIHLSRADRFLGSANWGRVNKTNSSAQQPRKWNENTKTLKRKSMEKIVHISCAIYGTVRSNYWFMTVGQGIRMNLSPVLFRCLSARISARAGRRADKNHRSKCIGLLCTWKHPWKNYHCMTKYT